MSMSVVTFSHLHHNVHKRRSNEQFIHPTSAKDVPKSIHLMSSKTLTSNPSNVCEDVNNQFIQRLRQTFQTNSSSSEVYERHSVTNSIDVCEGRVTVYTDILVIKNPVLLGTELSELRYKDRNFKEQSCH